MWVLSSGDICLYVFPRKLLDSYEPRVFKVRYVQRVMNYFYPIFSQLLLEWQN